MPMLHDPDVHKDLEARLSRLHADAKPKWGRMSVDQMLWHVNQAMGTALGKVQPDPGGPPIPAALLRFLVLKMPWTRNAPTNKAFIAGERYDFNAELARCRSLMREIVAQDVDKAPPLHPAFGQMTGRQQSQLHAKHLNHHFTQFGV